MPDFTWIREGVSAAEVADYEPGPGDKVIAIERGIAGGDFGNAGAAAGEIKRVLKKLAVAPKTVRQVAIACFEAEVNVVVYAREGKISAWISPGRIHVVVADRGPGIPDIAQAMTPGFTTASTEVREMGFGAGLGLPNIQQNVDYLKIESRVDAGTTVTFDILLQGS